MNTFSSALSFSWLFIFKLDLENSSNREHVQTENTPMMAFQTEDYPQKGTHGSSVFQTVPIWKVLSKLLLFSALFCPFSLLANAAQDK